MRNDPAEPVYTIGVVSRKFGVSPETLRLYEREGLLIPHRTETGRRLYSDLDLEWIDCIRNLITLEKLNIAGIRRLLALIPCWNLKPCTKEDQAKCAAFLIPDQVCWNLDETGDTCANEDCHACSVYHLARRVGDLKEIFELTSKKEQNDED